MMRLIASEPPLLTARVSKWARIWARQARRVLPSRPALVDTAGAAHNGVQQSRMQACGLVTGQIDRDGDRPVDPNPRRSPDVPIDS
jgi:hypothetical protein